MAQEGSTKEEGVAANAGENHVLPLHKKERDGRGSKSKRATTETRATDRPTVLSSVCELVCAVGRSDG